MFGFYIVEVGLGVDVFFSSTPYELSLIAEAYAMKNKNQYEMLAHTISVGIHNAMNKKKINLFEEEKTIKQIKIEDKRAQWDELLSKF